MQRKGLSHEDRHIREDSRDVLLLDGAGRIVSGSRLPDAEEAAEIALLLENAPSGRGRVQLGGVRMAAAWAELPFSGMTLPLVEQQDRLRHQILLMQIMTVLFALVICALSAVFRYAVSARISAPVEEPAETMKAVGRGDLGVRAEVRGKDEIGYLAVVFNRIRSHIGSLVERLARERAQTKEAELRALQYQIRPHFIYNTLNAIRAALRYMEEHSRTELSRTEVADHVHLNAAYFSTLFKKTTGGHVQRTPCAPADRARAAASALCAKPGVTMKTASTSGQAISASASLNFLQSEPASAAPISTSSSTMSGRSRPACAP